MLKQGVIMDVTTPEEARIAEEAGAVAVMALERVPADIRADGHHAVVRGVPMLTGCEVTAPDIRAGAALVVAGLAAEGDTVVRGVHHIDRGYDDLVGRLASLGASIERID